MAPTKKRAAKKPAIRRAPQKVAATELRAIRRMAVEIASKLPLPTPSNYGQQGLHQWVNTPVRTASSIIQDARLVEAYLLGTAA